MAVLKNWAIGDDLPDDWEPEDFRNPEPLLELVRRYQTPQRSNNEKADDVRFPPGHPGRRPR